ncbi:MAG: cytochrome-c peroxidase, partial [Bacteroidota bacterium]
MTNQTKLLLSLLFVCLITSCKKDEVTLSNAYSNNEFQILSSILNIPIEPFSYAIGNEFEGPSIDHKGTMGRVLFYDKQLSIDGSVSCESCHKQQFAFADNTSFSQGAFGNKTKRNSLALGALNNFGAHYSKSINGNSTNALFWDERAESVHDQLRQTIANPNEMGNDLQTIVSYLNGQEHYKILNKKAFNSETIDEDHVLEAIETFINSIHVDQAQIEGQVLGNLNYITGDSIVGTPENIKGIELFRKNCSSCHASILGAS